MKHEGNKHNDKAEAFLRRAGYGVDNDRPAEGRTSERRQGHVDIILEDLDSPSTRSCVNHDAADADYFGNLKKFERHDDMAAEPNRDKAGEPGGGGRRRK